MEKEYEGDVQVKKPNSEPKYCRHWRINCVECGYSTNRKPEPSPEPKYCNCKKPLLAEVDKPTFHNCYRCNKMIKPSPMENEFGWYELNAQVAEKTGTILSVGVGKAILEIVRAYLLKVLPQKQSKDTHPDARSTYNCGYVDGFNACLKEIKKGWG